MAIGEFEEAWAKPSGIVEPGWLRNGKVQRRKEMCITNADNEWLGPLTTSRYIIGYIDEVSGQGAEEIPDFVPTRYELIQLAKHWARRALEIRWFEFFSGQTGGREFRVKAFAQSRVNRIAAVLGEDEVDQAIDEVYVQFQQKQDQKLWDIFLSGDKSQWKEVQEEFHRRCSECCGYG